ncbi:phospholipid transport system substrate-binding protein [Tamilnaduibacter salinus]|uniref:Phospholipid transport system substrate-binding protein n=1 Tax=Tamilnaduibacter salinus TaxID=1484056 RepID=A0A2U1CUN5_9GAMM|nr:ABC transporter substrate-binding protein [Tamilnaduibacter salinus]PVY70769.1 phospholipid transport system substrate-binding protein [Tamilnaduibacter salinus]
MTMMTRSLVVLCAWLFGMAGMVHADEKAQLQQYVEDSSQELIQKLDENRDLYKEDPEAFYASMEEALSGFVDFRRIAARVMGRYARQASPEQRDQFVRAFKRSLFDAYARALVESGQFSITVTEVDMKPDFADRASVLTEIETDSGNRYPVAYSMHRDDNGTWKMENVIVEGVNIGLAFRDRFAQEMEAKRGNVQAVIDGWNETVKDLSLENEVEES